MSFVGLWMPFWSLFEIFLDFCWSLGDTFRRLYKYGRRYVLERFGENKGFIFGVRFRTRFGSAFSGASYSLFGFFLDPFGSLGGTFGRLLVKLIPKWSILAPGGRQNT